MSDHDRSSTEPAGARRPSSSGNDERSLADLVGQLGDDVKTLVRQEAALARAELREKLSQLGRGAALAAIGGLVLYAGLLALVFAAIFGLSTVLVLWIAAVIIAALVLVIGYILMQIGIRQLGASQSMPQRTLESVREDQALVKEAIDRRRH